MVDVVTDTKLFCLSKTFLGVVKLNINTKMNKMCIVDVSSTYIMEWYNHDLIFNDDTHFIVASLSVLPLVNPSINYE